MCVFPSVDGNEQRFTYFVVCLSRSYSPFSLRNVSPLPEVDQITSENGLSNDSVWDILNDSRGFRLVGEISSAGTLMSLMNKSERLRKLR